MDSSSRLGTVQWWRSRLEVNARRAYGDAKAKETAAREEEQRLRDALANESRFAGDAAMWELSDSSRAVGEKKVQAAAVVTAKAAALSADKRQAHVSAHQKLKAIEKVVQSLLDEAHADANRKERREQDEFAVLRFTRSP
jgi:hypothetical protein